jgi:hypothetical protein
VPVKQISVNLDNVPGKLSEVNDYLEENGINIIALSVADTTDMSLIRFVASDPEKAANVLKSHGYSINMIDVLAVEVPNHPGGLKAVLKSLKETSVNVNYLYVGLGTGEKTVLIMGVDKMVEAIQVLKKNWIQIYDEELYTL